MLCKFGWHSWSRWEIFTTFVIEERLIWQEDWDVTGHARVSKRECTKCGLEQFKENRI